MMRKRATVESVAEAYLELLAARGVEYFFGNAGTDFAPIIEAFARREAQGQARPRPMTVPHEIPAVAMAHGYAMVTGRPQVVMVHVTVGTANALSGIINAARSRAPMLMSAGRTPITEGGVPGSRNRHIHWAQESFDQAAMVREYVKWDYELRTSTQVETVVDRALAIATSEPAGPVYLALPREVLSERLNEIEYFDPSRLSPATARVADPAAVEAAARLLAEARNPIIIAKSVGRDPGAVKELVRLAEVLAIPVFEQASTHLNFPQTHPLFAGSDPAPLFGEVDAIVVVEADAPWFPDIKAPRPETPVIQIGEDPLFSRYPIRGFAGDLALAGTPRLTLAALADAAAPRGRRASPDRRAAHPLGGRAPAAGRRRGRPRPGRAERPAHRHGLALALRGRDRGRSDHRGERVRPRHQPDSPGRARHLLQPVAGLGPGLGAGRRAGGQAGGSRADRRVLRRRWRVLLRGAHRRPLDIPRPSAAGALHHLQQPRLERRQAVGAVARAARLGHAHHDAAERAGSGARLRADLSGLGGLGRAGGGSRTPCPTRSRARSKSSATSGARRCST